MDVFPQDLSSRWYAALVQARMPVAHTPRGRMAEERAATARPDPRPASALERFWLGGADVPRDPAKAAEVMGAMRARFLPARILVTAMPLLFGGMAVTMGALSGEPAAAAMMAGQAVFVGAIGLLMPRFRFGRIHKAPLAAREVEELLPSVTDDVERAYLTLVIDVIRQTPATVSPEAQEELRQALGALGEAIEQLPPGGISASVDADGGAAALRREADSVLAEAAAEQDRVTKESLERQAEALLRRAGALERMVTSVRRAYVLRRELRAQIEALRAGLAGFHTHSADVGELSSLAESVRRVAVEASSVAEARTELDTAAAAVGNSAHAVTAAASAAAEEETPQQTVAIRQGRA